MLGRVLHRIYVSALEAASCPRMGTLKAGEEGIPPGPFLLTSGPGHPLTSARAWDPLGLQRPLQFWPELGHPALSCPFSGPEDSLPGSSQPRHGLKLL